MVRLERGSSSGDEDFAARNFLYVDDSEDRDKMAAGSRYRSLQSLDSDEYWNGDTKPVFYRVM